MDGVSHCQDCFSQFLHRSGVRDVLTDLSGNGSETLWVSGDLDPPYSPFPLPNLTPALVLCFLQEHQQGCLSQESAAPPPHGPFSSCILFFLRACYQQQSLFVINNNPCLFGSTAPACHCPQPLLGPEPPCPQCLTPPHLSPGVLQPWGGVRLQWNLSELWEGLLEKPQGPRSSSPAHQRPSGSWVSLSLALI